MILQAAQESEELYRVYQAGLAGCRWSGGSDLGLID